MDSKTRRNILDVESTRRERTNVNKSQEHALCNAHILKKCEFRGMECSTTTKYQLQMALGIFFTCLCMHRLPVVPLNYQVHQKPICTYTTHYKFPTLFPTSYPFIPPFVMPLSICRAPPSCQLPLNPHIDVGAALQPSNRHHDVMSLRIPPMPCHFESHRCHVAML